MVFGIGSNQSDAVNRAQRRVKVAENALRDAQRELDRTPRSENLKATRARDACRRELSDAQSDLRAAESELRRANSR